MTNFRFNVEEGYARKHNEFFRDAKRAQISAALLALILVIIIGVVFAIKGVVLVSIAAAIILGVFALLSLALIPVLPKKMGTPQEYYDAYHLVPAVIAEVNARDIFLLAYVDAAAESEARGTQPALAGRVVTSVPGVRREVGARVPSMAVLGNRSFRSQHTYEEISPMPVAWGTSDQEVWRKAEQAIPERDWKRIEKGIERLAEVKKTKRNLLLLDK
ncbi:DUF3239 domain-containing protein [Corynebacterium auriscanis]|uniref:DUF3239 domain-containing protein n=1 Tax=Corynebacterium auriscanis TaxID=99807 RepID=UPI0022471FAA|nr:DUF3239 domain-containing protein [Corynebacterium auriscanis]MCX2164120.1 DUF3239 domain-containing protein [Corynebacterium auriscanis]